MEDGHRSLTEHIYNKSELLISTIFDLFKTKPHDLKGIALQMQMKEEITDLTSLIREQKEEINRLEQYSRRDSVRIHGIPDNGRDETSEECEQKFLRAINLTLGLSDINT